MPLNEENFETKDIQNADLNPEDSANNLKAKVEAVLFITARAMQPLEISELLNIPEEEIENALLDLMFDYSSRDGALEIDDED